MPLKVKKSYLLLFGEDLLPVYVLWRAWSSVCGEVGDLSKYSAWQVRGKD